MSIKIIEPISKYIKEFDTVDEFNLFYTKNKEEIDNITTHKLNKLYHIKGYRITKIKNVLMLKKNKDDMSSCEVDNDDNNNDEVDVNYHEINNEIQKINDEIKTIKQTINTIIDYLHL